MRATSRRRERPIRALLALIFIVPLASLIGLWGYAASVTVSNAIQEHNFNREDNAYGGWAQQVFSALANERAQAFIYLSSGRHLPISSYVAAQQATDNAVRWFQKGLTANMSEFTAAASPALRSFTNELAWLSGTPPYPGIRPEVAARTVTPLQAFNDYDQIIDSEFNLYAKLVQVNNTPLYLQAEASVDAGRAVELASREVTLLTGIAYAGGQMTVPERVLFTQTVGNRKLLLTAALGALQPTLGSGYRRADNSGAYKTFTRLEDLVIGAIASKAPLPATLSPLAVTVDAAPLFALYESAQRQDRVALSSLGTSVGNRLLAEVGLAGGIGLIAVVLSVFLMVWFGRRISRDLSGLQRAALDLAEERLPRVVARLSAGQDVDVSAEAAPIAAGRIAETARVAEAFSSVQRTAVEAAVGQARVRRGVSQVFRNLAWRSQSLLHRQLALLDAMERKQTEPETLDELFQLDHLTTRMRRHAEGLLILSDAPPGRGWRDPVVLIDVLRAAIAEIEDYKRVTVLCDSEDAIIGPAVADVIHLLAELIENAAIYSPNTTEVTVRGQRVANGFAVEVEDRGIGIRPEDLEAFNERLANPPEFDLADSNQLGLFVVARLAGKHQIRIALRPSPYGGTTAIVLLPHAIVASAPAATPRSGRVPTEIVAATMPRTVLGAGVAAKPSGRLAPGAAPHAPVAITAEADAPPQLVMPAAPEPVASAADPAALPESVASAADPAALPDPATLAPEVPARAEAQDDPWADSEAAAEGDSEPGMVSPAVRAAAMRAAAVGHENGGNGFSLASFHRNGGPNGVADADSASGSLGNGASTAAAAGASPNGTGDEDNETAETSLPWLPKRRRQQSLAPQLKIDRPAQEEAEPTDADGPSPDDTRALVESVHIGLNRARMTPAEDSWPEIRPWTADSLHSAPDAEAGDDLTEVP
jgi:signal transduction histidine kinase